MRFAEMDFSMEGRFQERLLKKIKAECFAELDDDDLRFVNAAGTPNIAEKKMSTKTIDLEME